MQHVSTIVIIAVLILFGMYRRVRRTIGFQKLARGRMTTRMVIFCIIGVLILVAGALQPLIYVYDAIGIAIGIVIAYYAMKTTSFEWRKDAWYYRPNPWIGALLVVLFAGRIVWRLYEDYNMMGTIEAEAKAGQQNSFSMYAHDPATALILFTIIAYYVVYYTFVIRKERHLEVEGGQHLNGEGDDHQGGDGFQ